MGIHSVIHYSKCKYHYMVNTYRYLRAARGYKKMSRQYRRALGYTTRVPFSGMVGGAPQQALGAVHDIAPSRTEEIKDIARLAGLHLNEVTALALILEGPVRFIPDLISAVTEAVTEYPYEFSRFLWQYALYLWRCFGYGFWLFKLCAFSLTMLFACWHGNARRAAFPLIMIGLCGFLSDLPLASVLMIGGPIVVAWFWLLQPSESR